MDKTVAYALGGGSDRKAPKKIDRIEHKKSHNGDHIFTHHHTHPEDHPAETHTKRGDDEMVEHMLAHAGTPNTGEPEADAGTPDAAAAQGGQPQPTAGSGDATPGAMTAMGAQ